MDPCKYSPFWHNPDLFPHKPVVEPGFGNLWPNICTLYSTKKQINYKYSIQKERK